MKNFRSKVFRQAYEMMKVTGKAFAVCLAKAWAIYRLYKRMKSETVSFAYEKADGSLGKRKEHYKMFLTSSKVQVSRITRRFVLRCRCERFPVIQS